MKPLRFIGEPIEVYFNQTPMLEKVPGCPNSFSWRDNIYHIEELINEWHDYRRRGRMARNMSSTHAARATDRGSWGVGQDYYRVRTREDRFFDLYYDRAPKGSDKRKGAWFLDRELTSEDKPDR